MRQIQVSWSKQHKSKELYLNISKKNNLSLEEFATLPGARDKHEDPLCLQTYLIFYNNESLNQIQLKSKCVPLNCIRKIYQIVVWKKILKQKYSNKITSGIILEKKLVRCKKKKKYCLPSPLHASQEQYSSEVQKQAGLCPTDSTKHKHTRHYTQP